MNIEDKLIKAAWNYTEEECPGVPYNQQVANAFIEGAKFIINNTTILKK